MGWQEIKQMIGSTGFLQRLIDYDMANVSSEGIRMIQPYVTNEKFTYANIKKSAFAAAPICNWVIAINNSYYLKNMQWLSIL